MKRSLLLACAIASTPNLWPGIYAASADDAIETIVITANRREQPIDEVGNSVTVITGSDIEAGQFIYTLDALATVPGVAISQNGSFGGTASVSIRGAGGNQTLVIVDGVRMNDPSSPGNSFNFANLDPYNVERIEVLRGPQSVLYGSDAIGGVVNVITKSGSEESGFSFFAEAGSFETLRAGANAFGGTERFGYNIAVSGTHSDGISAADEDAGNTEEDGFDGYTVSGKFTAQPTDLIRAELVGRHSDSRSEFDGFGPIDADLESNETVSTVLGRLQVDSPGGRIRNTLSVEYTDIDRENFSNGVQSFAAKGEQTSIDYLGVFDLTDVIALTAGAQRRTEKAETVAPEEIETHSLFGELAFDGIEGLYITGGIRYTEHETFGESSTGRVTASYKIPNTGTRFIANWAEGFKSPSVFQITYICTFCGLIAPTPNLQPETSEGYEFGVEQTLLVERLVLGATWFHLETENAIIFTFTNGYQNLGRARSQGLEVMFDAVLSSSVNLNGNFTYMDAVDLGTGLDLIREPEQAGYVALDWAATQQLSASVSATYNGEETDFGGGVIEAWTRVDVKASYDASDRIQIYGRIENLFDEDYQHVIGYGTPGLSGYLGVRLNW